MATAMGERDCQRVEVPVLGWWGGRRRASAAEAEEEAQAGAVVVAAAAAEIPRNPWGKRFRSTSSSLTPGAQRQRTQTMNV